MTSSDASRIQGGQVRVTNLCGGRSGTQADIPLQAKSGGDMSSGGFAARAQSAAAHNANAGAGGGQNGGGQSGGAQGSPGNKSGAGQK